VAVDSEVVLKTENLTKRFGTIVAVGGLNLEVFKGEIFGILGPNGAGKTTSINMMCGLLKPDSGKTCLYGISVSEKIKEIVLRVGVAPQNTVLWGKLTCIEQLEFMGQMYGVSSKEARMRGTILLEAMGLSEKTHKLASTLSGGMQRRLNLIMALIHEPDILFLDEPEAGLDPQSRVLVRDYIKTLAHDKKKTIIFTTHNMDEADRIADRVAIIDQGKLLTLDAPETLKHSIGEGDVLEIDIFGKDFGDAIGAVRKVVPAAILIGNTLVIRGRNVMESLPLIMDALKSSGLELGEIRLRENTLEDVFITLTGRRLRG
jgi:ABC-2 type transport system ATP-binding protein